MWGGDYVCIPDALQGISNDDVLLGISTYMSHDDFDLNCADLEKKPYYNKVKFIEEKSKLWSRIDAWDKAVEYFGGESGDPSAEYSGFLLNHTQKLAVDLADYYERSMARGSNYEFAIDPIPVLTETGGGTAMALFDGRSADSTMEHVGTWCGELLEIVDCLPDDYRLVACCFAEIRTRTAYLYRTFGVNDRSLVLNDRSGNPFRVRLSHPFPKLGGRDESFFIKAEESDDGVDFCTIAI